MAVREARTETQSCVPIKGPTAAVAFLTFLSFVRCGCIRFLGWLRSFGAGERRSNPKARGVMRLTGLLLAACISTACAEQGEVLVRWTRFAKVEGQPEAVPVQWIATQEGKFAHSIKIPNPVPKDSGYRDGMTSQEYFEHLCRTEAGEFVYKTVDNVEGFYFMRPPNRPSDDDLMDHYKLEAPEIERLFQLVPDTPTARARLLFVNPPWRLYRFIEEPSSRKDDIHRFVRAFGYQQGKSPMTNISTSGLDSRFALVWRGLRRPQDRELSIAGGEWIILRLESNEVLAIMRMYGLSPKVRNTSQGIWWLNASQCPGAKIGRSAAANSLQLYRFVSSVLRPTSQSKP